ncbi:WhiB family transcriptional regulator [Rhodococcus koreensis]|uniref:WhiB family transcriptional regulator n=1 Tax=Rhodococcus koreensis TaxID=99653 RepID=UPI0036734F6F
MQPSRRSSPTAPDAVSLHTHQLQTAAKSICAQCPVIEQCRRYALSATKPSASGAEPRRTTGARIRPALIESSLRRKKSTPCARLRQVDGWIHAQRSQHEHRVAGTSTPSVAAPKAVIRPCAAYWRSTAITRGRVFPTSQGGIRENTIVPLPLCADTVVVSHRTGGMQTPAPATVAHDWRDRSTPSGKSVESQNYSKHR